MYRNVVYTQSNYRRPICNRTPLGQRDLQDAIPAGWCQRCGAEIYAPGRQLCKVCAEQVRRHEKTRKPLPYLYQSEKPQ